MDTPRDLRAKRQGRNILPTNSQLPRGTLWCGAGAHSRQTQEGRASRDDYRCPRSLNSTATRSSSARHSPAQGSHRARAYYPLTKHVCLNLPSPRPPRRMLVKVGRMQCPPTAQTFLASMAQNTARAAAGPGVFFSRVGTPPPAPRWMLRSFAAGVPTWKNFTPATVYRRSTGNINSNDAGRCDDALLSLEGRLPERVLGRSSNAFHLRQ